MFVTASLTSQAQIVTWDGNGNSNNSGDWDVAPNWDTNVVPGASDNADLVNVTTGTRTVTVTSGNPQTVDGLTITQTAAGSVNILQLNDDLTVTSANDDPLNLSSSVGQGAIVVNVATGKSLAASRTSGPLTSSVDGTFNLASGAALTHSSSGNTDITHNGPITAGANSVLGVTGESALLTLNGNASFASGSVVKLTYIDQAGDVIFTNNADLDMNDATLEFAWNAPSSANPSMGRKFINTGNWVLSNGSSFVLTSTTGRPTTGGNNVSQNNENSGALRLESGSTMDIRTFYNTGTTQLGSNTAGVSDAQVVFGGQVAYPTFYNGQTAGGSADAGVLNVLGDAILGPYSLQGAGDTATLNNGSATSTGSIVNVGDGITPLTFTLQSAQVLITNYAGNTINLQPNSTLLLKSLLTNNTAGAVTISNSGEIVHEGTLQMQGNKSGARTITTTSTGIYRVRGTTAILQNNESTSGPTGTDLTLNFANSGLLSGATATDKLTYVNAIPGKSQYDTLAMNQTGGKVTPGNGTNGAGVASIGSLELVNMKLTLSSGVAMEFDLGGTPVTGLFDTLALSGTGAGLDLGTGAILDIWTVNGFSLSGGTYQIITTPAAVTGTFATLKFNGGALNGEYTVNYVSNGVVIDVVPEPSTALLLLGGIAAAGVWTFRHPQRG